MTIGLDQSKQQIDSRAGTLPLQLKNVLEDCTKFKTFLGTKQSTDLTQLGYSTAEVTTMINVFTVLDQLRQVFQGLATIPNAVDFRPIITPLIGVN